MKGYSIGIDVGGTKIAYGLFDSQRQLLAKARRPSNPDLAPSAFFDDLLLGLHELLEDQGISLSSLKGIGIGMPSYVRYEDGYILKTTNLTKIKEFPAKDYIQNALGENLPVFLDNDSHTGALAEHRYGAGRGHKNMLYCPVSTGISSGIVIDGKLFRGQYGWSGESGHMIITPGEGVLCGCGNRGCLMSWCSGSMIVKHIQNWIAAGESTRMVELAGGAENISCETLSAAWDLKDPMALKAVEQMARYLAIWAYNLYVTLNINCYVFGGGLLEMGDKLFGPMRRYFDDYNQDDAHPVFFKTAELEKDFGITGAMELLYQ